MAAFAIVSTLSAHAAVIDFSDIASGNCQTLGGTINSQGYTFTKGVGTDSLYMCNPFTVAANTSPALINANQTSDILMNQIGGGAFSLNSFSAGARFGQEADGLDVIGTLADTSTVSTHFTFTGQTWGSFSVTGFSNLVSVRFLATGQGAPEFAINNIAVDEGGSEAPEPASMALLGAGLVAAVVIRRRK